jgi:exodeoxyribonuclease VII small subunit
VTTASAITFEDGYARLNDIATRLTSDEVPVHEMCDLFAEGKGLEKALSAYLDEQKSRVEAIERGEGIQPFTVVAPGADTNAPQPPSAGPAVEPEWPEGSVTVSHRPQPPAPATDDDIPF